MNGIFARLLLLFGVLGAVCAAAFVLVSLYGVPALGIEGVQASAYLRAEQSADAAAERETRAVERWFTERRLELRLLAESRSLVDLAEAAAKLDRTGAESPPRNHRLRAVSTANHPGYLDLYVADPRSGRILASSGASPAQMTPQHLAVVSATLAAGMDEGVVVFADAAEPAALVVRPLRDIDAPGTHPVHAAGVLVARLSLLVPLQQDEVSVAQALGDSAAIVLVDARKQVIAVVGRSVAQDDIRRIAAQAQPGDEGVRRLPGAGTEIIAAYRALYIGGAQGFTLAAARGTGDVNEAVHSALVRLGLFGALSFALGMTLVVFAARRIAQAQAQLRESETRFLAIFDTAPQPISVVSMADRRFRNVNKAWLDISALTRDQVIGRTLEEVSRSHDAVGRELAYAALERDGFIDAHRVAYVMADGVERTWLMHGRVAELGGERVAIWAMSEVTEQLRAQRQVEELNASLESKVEERTAELKSTLDNLKMSQDALLQSEKLAALGRLVAGVAHELNTPIGNALLTASTVQAQAEEFERQSQAGLRRSVMQAFVANTRQASSILLRNLEKAAELIRSFKQVAADQSSSQRRGFALKEVVDEVLLAHHPIFRKTAVVVTSDVPEGIRLDSYPGPLGQVLGNLITNAVLHGFEGGNEGRVIISARLDGEDMVEIAVRDNGGGISEANLKRIFDPFFTTRMGRGGTGLGLSICHRIVTESLGGSIRVASRLREGSSFMVRIPLCAPAAAEQQVAA